MELTDEQKKFLYFTTLDGHWNINENGEVDVEGSVWLNSIKSENLGDTPIKFGRISGNFYCHNMKLTTLENLPNFIKGEITVERNNLTDYFKSIKEEDFKFWGKLNWKDILSEYPFLINIAKKYIQGSSLIYTLNESPLTKLYYKD